MKKRYYVLAGVLLLPAAFWCFFFWWSHNPRAAFYRHFDTWPPASVSGIIRVGSTHLASADEYLAFSAAPADIKRIIERRGFVYVGSEPHDSKFLDRKGWKRVLALAKRRDVQADRLYETGIQYGAFYVLVTNADSTRVFYHYVK